MTIENSEELLDEVVSLGLRSHFVGDANPLVVTLKVYEDDPLWPACERMVERWDGFDLPGIDFSPLEIERADWLELLPSWVHGYPQAERGTSFGSSTYSAWCEACGVSGTQARAFRMAREPRWGRRQMLQLNWVFDEFFCRPEIRRDVFALFGIGGRPVEDGAGRPLSTVVQLDVPAAVEVPTAGYERVACSACGAIKCTPLWWKPLAPPSSEPPAKVVRTAAWFGTDGVAFRPVLVTADVWRALAAHGVKGIDVRPATTVG